MQLPISTLLSNGLKFLAQSLLVYSFVSGPLLHAQTRKEPGVALLRDRTEVERPALMVLGVVHLSNPGHDVVNTKVDDVLAPERQRQLALLADHLAAFRPTRIAVEWPRSAQTGLDRRYADYREGRYTLGRGEVDQIGLRVASMLKLSRVEAIDWNEMPPGQIADFDYEAYAEANGMQARLDSIRKPRAATTGPARKDLVDWLAEVNEPAALETSNRAYFDYILFGDGTRFPGANWVGNWYARNLKIFANLMRLPLGPQDRVLVIYGAGHAFLLRQFAEQSGAFKVEDFQQWLRSRKSADGATSHR